MFAFYETCFIRRRAEFDFLHIVTEYVNGMCNSNAAPRVKYMNELCRIATYLHNVEQSLILCRLQPMHFILIIYPMKNTGEKCINALF